MSDAKRCVVCGRAFSEGQGVIIMRGGLRLHFHSAKCAAKFFKIVMLEAPDVSCVERQIQKTIADLEKSRERVETKRL
ncbi:MAG: hypothetical protein QXU97_01420 [Fervidicoccaceae archaeon]